MIVKRFIVVTTALTLLFLAPFTLGGILLPPQYQDTFMGELSFKMERFEKAEGKRLVVIGGSGMAFAIDSALLEEAFGEYTVVNLGMYADLGTKFLLDLTKGEFREGDLVILAPELHAQTLSTYFGAKSALQGMDGAWHLLTKVSREDWGALLGNLPAFSLEKWRCFLAGESLKGEGIYARSSFNSYGDIESPLATSNVMPGYFDPSLRVSFHPDLLEKAFVEEVQEYASQARRKGASLFWAFCPVNRLSLEEEDIYTPEGFYEALYESFSFPILGDPRNAVLEEEWFFDTNFHLNQSGRRLYTVQLIRDLKATLGITTPTEVSLPAAPALPQGEGEVFLASTWAGDSVVEEITVPEEVVRVEDFAFAGCTSLRRIHLLSETPSRLLVGDHLLDGCSALLYVPKGSLSAYRTDYRFSRYAGRIREEEG